jgi:hypothetical protein
LPVAYLLDEREINDDPTNFWIFSHMGLRRLIDRSGWDILDFMSTGCTRKSNPIDRDERAFCLLRSRCLDFSRAIQLLDGWYPLEEGKWRWTERSFAVQLELPVGHRHPDTLVAHFYLPGSVFDSLPAIVLGAEVNGITLPSVRYSRPGEHVYEMPIPLEATRDTGLLTRFTLRDTFRADGDPRPLGLLVNFSGSCPIQAT